MGIYFIIETKTGTIFSIYNGWLSTNTSTVVYLMIGTIMGTKFSTSTITDFYIMT